MARRRPSKKKKAELEEEERRKREIAEINREFTGVERIMALEWAGYL
jgi:hypothetical protein